ncbi:MAG: hypothetical protein JXA54_12945 [Candidatus Heimdallarchaeota archaeon]|nr:hypothetical protein [Candidatus Heimdallarchaeota archaeon]
MTNYNKRKTAGSGMGLPTILVIVFIILKLTNVIDWKWLWVFSPIWIGLSLAVLFFLIIGGILFAAVIGIASHSSRAIMEIKSWFSKKDLEEAKEVKIEDEE